MAGESAHWRLDMETFHGFRDNRPRYEKWELIDGRPHASGLQTIHHQRICRNLEGLLNDCLEIARPNWRAGREVGLLIPQDEKYNPEPDVTVIDAEIELGQFYAERFYLVAEVLSGSDQPWVLKAKLDYYRRHEPCFAVLFVRQDQIAAEYFARDAGWTKADWTDPATRLHFAIIGDIGPLSDLYRSTPLALRPS